MHHPKVHIPNILTVIIDESNSRGGDVIDSDFFPQFTTHSVQVPDPLRKEAMIFVGNVSAYSDGIQPMQPFFFSTATPLIAQESVIPNKQDVRDQLFVASVLFGFAP